MWFAPLLFTTPAPLKTGFVVYLTLVMNKVCFSPFYNTYATSWPEFLIMLRTQSSVYLLTTGFYTTAIAHVSLVLYKQCRPRSYTAGKICNIKNLVDELSKCTSVNSLVGELTVLTPHDRRVARSKFVTSVWKTKVELDWVLRVTFCMFFYLFIYFIILSIYLFIYWTFRFLLHWRYT